jgi:hypothetical protein
MKNNLEICKEKINKWLNIIFGTKQKFNEKKEQYFRTESYLDNQNKNKDYLNDNIALASIEFGLIPLQTIFDDKLLSNIKFNKYEKFQTKSMNRYVNWVNTSITSKDKIDNLKYEIPNYFHNKYKEYWDTSLNIDFKISDDDKIGKLKIYKNDYLIDEIMDHNAKIVDFFYNRRLNMFATTSYDGFICIYIIPNKLISMIKHPNNSYYDTIFLSANPFPTVIACNKKENTLTSYSLSGILIKASKLVNENNADYKIIPYFNVYGGAFKDRIIISGIKGKDITLYVPFFDIIKE